MNVIIGTIALLVSFSVQLCVGVKCPPSQVILPCTCAQYLHQISCWNIKQDFNLTQVFDSLTKAVGNNNNNKQLVFDEFRLIDSELSEIGTDSDDSTDFFNGVAFQKITISKNRKLKRIHTNALKSSFKTSTSITITENPILANDSPNERQIFDLLNSFESATEIWLTDNNISVIPEKAFNRAQPSLNLLSLIDNNIVSVGAQAFHSLSALNYLLLDGNRIHKISNKAFEFIENKNNSQLLRIFLRDNDLNDESIESGTFDQIDRKVLLDLSKNNMTHLKKSVFGPIFRHKGSAIILRHNPLICDCNFKWLYDRRLLYNSSHHERQYNVHSIQCNGTKHESIQLNELTENHFQHCPNDYTNDCFLNSDWDYDYQLCINSAKQSIGFKCIPILLIDAIIFYLLIQ